MRPDRPEVITAAGAGRKSESTPGIQLDCLVGPHNQACDLTTGLATFQPGTGVSYHTHTFSESVTLLQGKGRVQVEGREYKLEPLDNVTIPRGLAHRAFNPSKAPSLFHVAVPTSTLTREIVDRKFAAQPMPSASTGFPGAEYVTRMKTALRYETGSNTICVDYFNARLVPGLEMSGGYALFQHGGRLPAHVHDFDESICIIQGEATCIVEGRRYTLADHATALQPRGRVHYFMNDSSAPMAMIWVYAGPMPERIIVDECCATVEGNPWKP